MHKKSSSILNIHVIKKHKPREDIFHDLSSTKHRQDRGTLYFFR